MRPVHLASSVDTCHTDFCGFEKRCFHFVLPWILWGGHMYTFFCVRCSSISKVFARYVKSVGILLRLITVESAETKRFLQMGAEIGY